MLNNEECEIIRTANTKSPNVTKLDLLTIKEHLQKIYETNPNIHVTIREGRTKLDNVASRITGIYNHFMCVTSDVKNYMEESFTINFIDIVIGKFRIKELDELLNMEE